MNLFCVVRLWIFLSGFLIVFTKEIHIHGHSAKDIVITCSHVWASTNLKYFCREPCTNETSYVVSSYRSINGRYRLEDFGNGTFTVNIADLQKSDTGIYWCGVDRAFKDTYNKVNLTVCKDSSITITTEAYKEIQTSWFATTPAAAHLRSQSTSASQTSRGSSPDDITLSPSATVSAHTSQYFVGGLVMAAILFLIGLATVHLCRKIVETTESCATATPVNRNNACQHAENSTEMKSTDKQVRKSQTDSVYQKLNLSKVQSNEVYGNL